MTDRPAPHTPFGRDDAGPRSSRGHGVAVEVASEGFSGYSRFAFVTGGDALRSMAITA